MDTGDGEFSFVHWSGNKWSVTTYDNKYDTGLQVIIVERHVIGSHDTNKVQQPLMICKLQLQYVSGMGGVDLMKYLSSAYRPCIKSKKIIGGGIYS